MHATVWSLRQRVLIVVVTLVAAMAWRPLGGLLQTGDGGGGISLWTNQAGVFGLLILLLMGGVVLLLGAVVASQGSLLQGLFVVTGSLTCLAGWGGPMDDWLLRAAGIGSVANWYSGLIGEVFLWFVLLGLAYLGLIPVQRYLVRRVTWLRIHDRRPQLARLDVPDIKAWISGAITATVGGLLSLLLIRSSDGGQVVGSLVLSFALGAGLARSMFPRVSPIPLLAAPAIVAVLAYAHVAWHLNTPERLLTGWYRMNSDIAFNDRMPGPGLALPIHYASAAVTGCLLGMGIAQGMQYQAARHHRQPALASDVG